MKKVAIVQSNYIPWKGYFDLIASVDEFIIYDDVQFTKRDWRNRNKIKTPNGTAWLTVPVKSKSRYEQSINETEIDGNEWARKHWRAIEASYRKAEHFDTVADLLKPVYDVPPTMLSQLNRVLMEIVCGYMGIRTPLTDSHIYEGIGSKTDRLLSLCRAAKADIYVSGPAAKRYLETDAFRQAGIDVRWFDYAGYPEYRQLWGDFVHEVSVVDLLFNCGKGAGMYLERNVE